MAAPPSSFYRPAGGDNDDFSPIQREPELGRRRYRTATCKNVARGVEPEPRAAQAVDGLGVRVREDLKGSGRDWGGVPCNVFSEEEQWYGE